MAEQTVAEAKSVMQVGRSYTGFGKKALPPLQLPLLPLPLLPACALPLPNSGSRARNHPPLHLQFVHVVALLVDAQRALELKEGLTHREVTLASGEQPGSPSQLFGMLCVWERPVAWGDCTAGRSASHSVPSGKALVCGAAQAGPGSEPGSAGEH